MMSTCCLCVVSGFDYVLSLDLTMLTMDLTMLTMGLTMLTMDFDHADYVLTMR